MQVCNCSITQAIRSTPSAVLSVAGKGVGLGCRAVSYGCSLGVNVLRYSGTFFKDLAKSGASLCNNNARQIGIATVALSVVAVVIYCARKFFKPAPTPGAPPAPPADPVPAVHAHKLSRAERLALRNAAKDATAEA